jgi:hypothetical protein
MAAAFNFNPVQLKSTERIALRQPVALSISYAECGRTFIETAGATQTAYEEDGNERDWEIEQQDIPSDEPYRVLRPIPVKIKKSGELDFVASFDAANLAMGGENFRDAFHHLIFELLDSFDYLSANVSALGSGPRDQFRVLSQHLVKTDRRSR